MIDTMADKPKVLRTAVQLAADLDLAGREYPADPAELSSADDEALHLEWLTTKTKTGESFAEFLKRRLKL